jgi:subtilisin-like proprotein convertase family protein
MKKLILLFIAMLLFSSSLFGQYINETKVDSVVNLVSLTSLAKFMREFTGDTATTIGGIPYLLYSRYSPSPANPKAAQYLYEKFQSYGLNVRYQVGDSNTTNVIARITGTKYPNQKIVIGAHYDNILWPVLPQPPDTVHGADDNASGTIALLEMARLIAGMSFEYTIEFAAWDNEEVGLFGSRTYADTAYFHGDSIRFYINMDMISFNYLNQNKFQAGADSNSVFYNQLFEALKTRYVPQYTIYQTYATPYGGSDYVAFAYRKYRAFSTLSYSITPEYHKITDDFAHISIPYLTDFVKPLLGMLMVIAENRSAFFEHKPLVSTSDTTSRNLWAIIKFPNQLPTMTKRGSPKLYYKINSSQYVQTSAYYHNQDTFKFAIAGAPKGSTVKYYIAAQDSLYNFVCTYPVGGSGINPPGSTPPATPFVYFIYNIMTACSNTLPKPINDLQYTLDSIYINSTETVNKVRVNLSLNHTNDGDIVIQLLRPGGLVNLAQRNGSGGQNYINTTFDDTASLSISQGTPPFTGVYRPMASLSSYNNNPVSGYWILRIYDLAAGNTGTLISWCLQLETKGTVGVEENTVPQKYELSQNYPNPFNPTTVIRYQLSVVSNVTLKVYDVMGREVQTLVNKRLNAGTYETTFDASMLSSGVYFYRMEVRHGGSSTGDFTDVKRFVVLK